MIYHNCYVAPNQANKTDFITQKEIVLTAKNLSPITSIIDEEKLKLEWRKQLIEAIPKL